MKPWRDPVVVVGTLAVWIASLVAVVAIRIRVGAFAYPLDDAYIHMATARHLVQDGVWGVTPYGFDHVSSSPLWTLLVALAFAVTGVHVLTPLILNFLLAPVAIWALAGLLPSITRRRAADGAWMRGPAWWPKAAVVAAIGLAAPLSTMVVLGMEHTLHIALALVAFRLVCQVVEDPGKAVIADASDKQGAAKEDAPIAATWRAVLVLAAVFALMVATRYEGLFLVGIGAGLLTLRRRPLAGGLVLVLGMAPLAAMGAYAMAQGAGFLPNGVALKGDSLPALSFSGALDLAIRLVVRVVRQPNVLTPLVLAAPAWWLYRASRLGGGRTFWSAGQVATLAWFGMACAHLMFAQLGWFYRYETYLLVLAAAIAVGEAKSWLDERRADPASRQGARRFDRRHLAAVAVVLLLLLGPMAARGLVGGVAPPRGSEFIHTQQVQTGRFLALHYEDQPVAINDIGVPTFLADLQLLDTWGLASQEVADLKKAGAYNTTWLADEAERRGVQVAIIYDFWLDGFGGTPESWVAVGNWSVREGPALQQWVSIYAVDEGHADLLMSRLCDFTPELPRQVTVRGAYLDHAKCQGVEARSTATVVHHES